MLMHSFTDSQESPMFLPHPARRSKAQPVIQLLSVMTPRTLMSRGPRRNATVLGGVGQPSATAHGALPDARLGSGIYR